MKFETESDKEISWYIFKNDVTVLNSGYNDHQLKIHENRTTICRFLIKKINVR
jgi:hypothetical protein